MARKWPLASRAGWHSLAPGATGKTGKTWIIGVLLSGIPSIGSRSFDATGDALVASASESAGGRGMAVERRSRVDSRTFDPTTPEPEAAENLLHLPPPCLPCTGDQSVVSGTITSCPDSKKNGSWPPADPKCDSSRYRWGRRSADPSHTVRCVNFKCRIVESQISDFGESRIRNI